ncbi:MAG TPA: 4Fe-4S binding protein [Clostridiales bacterium]|nr:4Fe-4S binding protein [Clostridiales bacterium]
MDKTDKTNKTAASPKNAEGKKPGGKKIPKRKKLSEAPRHIAQAVWTAVTNSYVAGFLKGRIYQGELKKICVPGMNCYSCPGALGSCPIGAMQAVVGSSGFKFSYYVVGFLTLIGALIGRFVCGWLCPFGLFQDLLHKIPFPKKIKTFRGDKPLRLLKYVIFAVFVILLPMFLTNDFGNGSPYFCKLICPVGTAMAGIPLLMLNESMRALAGFLFRWKLVILIITVLLSILIYRPFCKYICPLGAVYSLFNRISVFKYRLDETKCISCGACSRVCKMNIDPTKNCNSPECIRCGLCKKACPTDAITYGFISGGVKAGKSKLVEDIKPDKTAET